MCVFFFVIWSSSHTIVILMVTLTVWGGFIKTPSSIMFKLLDSRCFLQVCMTVNMWDDVGTISYMHTCDYHLNKFQNKRQLHAYTRT